MACVGCEIKEEAQKYDVEALIAEQLQLEGNLAEAALVEKRVAICENCDFHSKHTCTKCGCFYKFRANLAIKNCPENKWDEIVMIS